VPPPPSREEQAVVKMAKINYPSQNIIGARCAKTGFDSTGDIYSCTLRTTDGETTPNEWHIVHAPDGQVFALPPAG
jgi:hypothetical protein